MKINLGKNRNLGMCNSFGAISIFQVIIIKKKIYIGSIMLYLKDKIKTNCVQHTQAA